MKTKEGYGFVKLIHIIPFSSNYAKDLTINIENNLQIITKYINI